MTWTTIALIVLGIIVVVLIVALFLAICAIGMLGSLVGAFCDGIIKGLK